MSAATLDPAPAGGPAALAGGHPDGEACFVAVVGNPNVGKSTLFNALTGLRQRVANYAGVTVEAMEGRATLPSGAAARVVDLPGTYSLVPSAMDEAEVERVLEGGWARAGGPSPAGADGSTGPGEGRRRAPDVVVAVLDATNLRRNLFLLSEVLDLGLPVVVALNLVDEARRGGLDVPTARLREALGCPVVETVALRGEGTAALLAAVEGAWRGARPPGAGAGTRAWRFADPAREARLAALLASSGAPGPGAGEPSPAGAGGPGASAPATRSAWGALRALRAEDPSTRAGEIAARYAWVARALGDGPEGPDGGGASRVRARSDRLDAVLLHPVLGPLCFLLCMGLLFQAVFQGAEPLVARIEAAQAALATWATGWLEARLPASIAEATIGLVTDGVIAGVGAVVVFLPQILILFLALGLLEDTGYMARAAFLVDRPLRALGLSGRSFIPLLSGFACAIPAVMATRTIPARRERLLAVLLIPLMACSARLPVYTLLIGAVVPEDAAGLPFVDARGLALLALYLLGMAGAVVVALVVGRLGRGRARGKELPLVVELPPYRRPALRGVLLKLRLRAGDFLKRAGTVIFLVTVLMWVLMTYPRVAPDPARSPAEQRAAAQRASVAGRLGQALEPALAPLGFDWKIGVGIIGSFAAREVFVATLGIVYAADLDAPAPDGAAGPDGAGEVDDAEKERRLRARLLAEVDPRTGRRVFSTATVAALLVFYVFALQCGSTVAVVRREAGSWRFALGQLVGFTLLAWFAALVTYQGLAALGY